MVAQEEKSGFILWGPWISVQTVLTIFLVVVKIIQSCSQCWNNIIIPRASSMAYYKTSKYLLDVT